MRITCPNCSLSYQIPRESLGDGGRSVRCADCRTVWFVSPSPVAQVHDVVDVEPDGMDFAAGEAGSAVVPGQNPMNEEVAFGEMVPAVAEGGAASSVPAPVASIEVVAAKRYKTAKPARKDGGRRWFGFDPGLVLAACLVAILAGAVLARVPIVRQVPHLASLYARLGLPVNLRGIDIHDVVTRTEYEDGQPVVVVEGRIQNASSRTVQVPQMRFAARSVTGTEIYAWVLSPGRPMLGVRESVAFRTKFPNPPKDAQDVEVRFVTAKERPRAGGAKS